MAGAGEPTGSRGDDEPSPAAAGPAGLAGVVVPAVALVAVVAAATTGAGLLAPGADLDDGTSWAVRLGGLALLIAGLVGLLAVWRRRASLGRDSLPTALVAAGVLFILLTVLTAPHSDVDLDGSTGDDPTTTTTTAPWDTTTSRPTPSTTTTLRPPAERWDDPDDGLTLVPLLVMALLAGLAVVATLGVLRSWGIQPRWRSGGQVPPLAPEEPPVDAAAAEAGLTASLATVQAGDDARAAIVRAYAALLDALAEAGGGRRPEEAPHEHLDRVLGPLGVRPEPVHGLAELFVMARFSSRPVTERHRHDAATWLQAALDDLRASTAAAAAKANDREASAT